MLHFAKYIAAAAALALAPAAIAGPGGHGHGGGGAMAAMHSQGAMRSMMRGDNRADAAIEHAFRHDGDRSLTRVFTDNRHRGWTRGRHYGWTRGHHYGWTKHGRHHLPGAMTHTSLTRSDRLRHRHTHVDHRRDR